MAPIKTKAKNLDMTQGEPARLLVLFAIPMLIGGIFQLMYNMTDTLVVGRFASVDALAAIGATGSTTSLIMMLGPALPHPAGHPGEHHQRRGLLRADHRRAVHRPHRL